MDNSNTKKDTQSKTNEPNKYVVDEILKDLEKNKSVKLEKSHQFFKDTRIDSCTHVVIKNGVAQAVPFRPSNQKEEPPKQVFTDSLSHNDYKVHSNMHVGMTKKPLVPYDPNSYRNRLPIPDIKKPPTNASSIEIGDRSANDKKRFVTNTKNTYGSLMANQPVTNTGILAEKTKWHHYLQHK